MKAFLHHLYRNTLGSYPFTLRDVLFAFKWGINQLIRR